MGLDELTRTLAEFENAVVRQLGYAYHVDHDEAAKDRLHTVLEMGFEIERTLGINTTARQEVSSRPD